MDDNDEIAALRADFHAFATTMLQAMADLMADEMGAFEREQGGSPNSKQLMQEALAELLSLLREAGGSEQLEGAVLAAVPRWLEREKRWEKTMEALSARAPGARGKPSRG
jgi:hypothetical protein